MNIRDAYIEFFKERDHAQIPSAPIVPENDPSVLFNTAGMQPLVPYLKGAEHPNGTRLCDYQKCLRTNDLDEVGDTVHHTFFEMLGNWSLGDYFKKESLTWSFEFLTKSLNVPVEKLAVSVFAGNEVVPADEESIEIWKSLGLPEKRIKMLQDNWWPNMEATGPCGPDSEIFYWSSTEPVPEEFDPNDETWVEIWNNVFMQCMHHEDGSFSNLPKKNVDTGMGLERITAVLEGVKDNYQSSVWKDVIAKIVEIADCPYEGNEREMRIIADHIRSAVFISADPAGIKPSNTDQGYILRRLIRRTIRYAKSLGIDLNSNWEVELAQLIVSKFGKYYPELERNAQVVYDVLTTEKVKFGKTLDNGLKEFAKITENLTDKKLNKDLAFKLYDTYGFPLELTVELSQEKGIEVDTEGFKEKFEEHKAKSRQGAEQKFKGGLASSGETEAKYHTATHLLNAALKQIVNENIHQKGSNITAERMRFDFNCDHKLTDEEKSKVEALVNEWIQAGLDVTIQQMSKADAIASGAEASFIERYPDPVTVYSIGDVSREVCGGPHATNTNILGTFKIKKEEAVASGIRRIKAVLTD
ncbi:MAG: alanine--tRNA ligase [Alphaproteobacteria bacterium]|nr:alanine--tRNA ligase [Alphaproteobacteria bacterium]